MDANSSDSSAGVIRAYAPPPRLSPRPCKALALTGYGDKPIATSSARPLPLLSPACRAAGRHRMQWLVSMAAQRPDDAFRRNLRLRFQSAVMVERQRPAYPRAAK